MNRAATVARRSKKYEKGEIPSSWDALDTNDKKALKPRQLVPRLRLSLDPHHLQQRDPFTSRSWGQPIRPSRVRSQVRPDPCFGVVRRTTIHEVCSRQASIGAVFQGGQFCLRYRVVTTMHIHLCLVTAPVIVATCFYVHPCSAATSHFGAIHPP